jgi:hypothetical protein
MSRNTIIAPTLLFELSDGFLTPIEYEGGLYLLMYGVRGSVVG